MLYTPGVLSIAMWTDFVIINTVRKRKERSFIEASKRSTKRERKRFRPWCSKRK